MAARRAVSSSSNNSMWRRTNSYKHEGEALDVGANGKDELAKGDEGGEQDVHPAGTEPVHKVAAKERQHRVGNAVHGVPIKTTINQHNHSSVSMQQHSSRTIVEAA